MQKILIIDDCKEWLALMSKCLALAGFEAVTAETGRTGLKLAQTISPDMILLDWHLGEDISGIELLCRIKTEPITKNIPVILISGIRQSYEDENSARQAGADLFVTKTEITEYHKGEQILLRHIKAILSSEKPSYSTGKMRTAANSSFPDYDNTAFSGNKQHYTVFIADDDPDFLDYITCVLKTAGYIACSVQSGKGAVEKIKTVNPDAAIIDLQLPGMSGLTICKHLKQDELTRSIPTMILTAKANKPNWLASIRCGVDLFYQKPIKHDDFLQCMDALIHRIPYEKQNNGIIEIGCFRIDPAKHVLIFAGREIPDLTTKLFDLAYLLAQNRPRIISRKEILRHLKIPKVKDNEVNVMMHRVRKWFGSCGKEIFKSASGQGYYFDESAVKITRNAPDVQS